jgi:hypothetical protein
MSPSSQVRYTTARIRRPARSDFARDLQPADPVACKIFIAAFTAGGETSHDLTDRWAARRDATQWDAAVPPTKEPYAQPVMLETRRKGFANGANSREAWDHCNL